MDNNINNTDFNKLIEQIINSDFIGNLMQLLSTNKSSTNKISSNDIFNDLLKILDDIDSKDDKQKERQLPSSQIPHQIGLNIHKLVQKYIDTEIDEYEDISKNQRNDLYARLYEFGCWVYNQKDE